MTEADETGNSEIIRIGQRHGLSAAAVEALSDAVRRGGGGLAQFNHPELGGMGQWSAGGMTQIGDMFNNDLKTRVAAACRDLAQFNADAGIAANPDGGTSRRTVSGDWWQEELGQPSSSGSQNDMRYACFPEHRRLAILKGGAVTVYDTGHYRLTGFSQQQSTDQELSFSGPDGTVGTDRFRIV